MSMKEAVRQSLYNKASNNPEYLRLIFEYYKRKDESWQRLKCACGDEDCEINKVYYKDFLLSTWGTVDPIIGGELLTTVHCHLGMEGVHLFPIYVGQTPSRDSDLEENKRKLSNLHQTIDIGINNEKKDDDGHITIKNQENNIDLYLPVEIGSCDPEVLLLHIIYDDGFCRWPYDSKYMFIFYIPPNQNTYKNELNDLLKKITA